MLRLIGKHDRIRASNGQSCGTAFTGSSTFRCGNPTTFPYAPSSRSSTASMTASPRNMASSTAGATPSPLQTTALITCSAPLKCWTMRTRPSSRARRICSPSAPSGSGSPLPAWTPPQKPSPCPLGKKPAWIWRICPSSPARVRTTSSTS